MIGSPSVQRIAHVPGASDRQPFLASSRAAAACTREFARLSDEVRHGVAMLPALREKAVTRQSPDRCIVQLGPVALTMAWLQSGHESVATGELLVIVWRGAVAPVNRYQPERPSTGAAPRAATSLWEQVLTVVGDSETTWAWQPRDADIGRCSSTELAARCVERLRFAYLECGGEPSLEPTP
jgi:hypothetical protein